MASPHDDVDNDYGTTNPKGALRIIKVMDCFFYLFILIAIGSPCLQLFILVKKTINPSHVCFVVVYAFLARFCRKISATPGISMYTIV
jgi:hypothetical protein